MIMSALRNIDIKIPKGDLNYPKAICLLKIYGRSISWTLRTFFITTIHQIYMNNDDMKF